MKCDATGAELRGATESSLPQTQRRVMKLPQAVNHCKNGGAEKSRSGYAADQAAGVPNYAAARLGRAASVAGLDSPTPGRGSA